MASQNLDPIIDRAPRVDEPVEDEAYKSRLIMPADLRSKVIVVRGITANSFHDPITNIVEGIERELKLKISGFLGLREEDFFGGMPPVYRTQDETGPYSNVDIIQPTRVLNVDQLVLDTVREITGAIIGDFVDFGGREFYEKLLERHPEARLILTQATGMSSDAGEKISDTMPGIDENPLVKVISLEEIWDMRAHEILDMLMEGE